jgi:hypothetical protein
MANGEQAPQKKKGLGTLAWVGIGCGALILVAVVVLGVGGVLVAHKAKEMAGDFEANPGLATARMIVRLNPDLEEVSADEDAGTITVRNTKTGEVATVDFDQLKEGKIRWKSGGKEMTIDASGKDGGQGVTITSSEGDKTMTLTTGATAGDVPDWVPVYPGAEPQGVNAMTGDEGSSGVFQVTTDAAVSDVISYYKTALDGEGFEVTVNTFSGSGGEEGGMVRGELSSAKRNVTAMVGVSDGATTVNISYSEGS